MGGPLDGGGDDAAARTHQMIIRSLLDTDLYKFTMMQVVLHHFPGAHVEYRFKCRNANVDLTPYVDEIREEIRALCSLRFTPRRARLPARLALHQERLRRPAGPVPARRRASSRCRGARIRRREIDITIKGPWLHTILFEVPVLAIVSEIYYRNNVPAPDFAEGRRRLRGEDRAGERRRRAPISASPTTARAGASRAPGRTRSSARSSATSGRSSSARATSTSRCAQGLTPLGTMAHEYLQACQAVGPRLRDSQHFAFDIWARSTAATSGSRCPTSAGMDAFLRDFDLFFCKLFDGVRHDSGDPFEWGEKLIAHYRRMRIDPQHARRWCSRTASTFRSRSACTSTSRTARRPSFGIGTNLTNDLGYEPLQIVIKMTRCNGQPVAKISDEPSQDDGLRPVVRRVPARSVPGAGSDEGAGSGKGRSRQPSLSRPAGRVSESIR